MPSPPLPLSAAQQGIWLGQQLEPRSAMYNAGQCVRLHGDVDLGALAGAVERAHREAEGLGARITGPGEAPRWGLPEGEGGPVPLERLDLRGQVDPWTAARAHMRRSLARRFDLEAGPLARHLLVQLSDDSAAWFMCAHHVALDGYGFALVTRRVASLYSAHVRNAAAGECDFASLRTVLDEDLRYRRSTDREVDARFWRDTLVGTASAVGLAGGATYPTAEVHRAGHTLTLAAKGNVDALARGCSTSWPAVLAATFAAYLARNRGEPDVVLGLPVLCRRGQTLRAPAMTMNIVPLRLQVPRGASLRSLTEAAAAELTRVRPHDRYRYEDLRRDLGRVGGGRRLFGPVLNLLPFAHAARFAGCEVEVDTLSAGPVEDLAWTVRPTRTGGPLQLGLEGHGQAYANGEVEAHLHGLVTMLEAGTRVPSAPLWPSTAPGADEPPAVVQGEPLHEAATDVLQRLWSHASRAPAHEAVVHGCQTLTYGALVARAEGLAAHLRRAGVRPGDRVALCLPRSVDAIVALVATLRVGAAYLPLDPEAAHERNQDVLADAAPRCVLTRKGLAPWLPETALACLYVEDAPDATPDAGVPDGDDDGTAYVIYTSGSTGSPSGVRVGRRALAHFVAAATQRYGVGAHDRILQFAPLHFDASVEEIFLALGNGGTLVLRTQAMLDSLAALLEACQRQRVSVLDLPTALWHELTYLLARGGGALPACVRTVILGGEAALPARVAEWRAHVDPQVALLNTYGPTEATVVATVAALHAGASEDPGDDIPIGLPLPGTAAVVIRKGGRPARRGERGELVLLGPCLAEGYLQRPEREAARFVHLEALPGQPRGYRTGDLAVLRPDGMIAYRGRLDDEVKISGQRIDPREVESVLLRHASVREAAVVVERRGELGARLVAFVAASEGEGSLDAEALGRHAARWLLAVAVPAEIRALSGLPRTSTGKVDRRALARQLGTPSALDGAPGTGLEARVLGCLREVLGHARLGPDDNFFDGGGHSLQAIQAANRLAADLARPVDASLLFRAPSARELAAALGEREPGTTAHAQEATLRADLEPGEAVRVEPGAPPAPPRSVLLTGATGFVGAHVLAALRAETDLEVICPVRARDDAQAAARVQRTMAAHGLDLRPDARTRFVACDLAALDFGPAAEGLGDLAGRCDAIVHCAASVSLVRDYASVRRANVQATRALLGFACAQRPKAFHHVSTLAAAALPGAEALPEAFVDALPALRDGYAQSKWVAEGLVARAVERGVRAHVYRLGRVVGPAGTAAVNPQDIFFRMLGLGVPAGVMPALALHEPWTPVDAIARALARLVVSPPAGSGVLNVAPSAPVALAEVLDWVEAYGYPLERCAPSEWARRIGDVRSDEHAATLAFFTTQLGAGPAPFPRRVVSDAFRTEAARVGVTASGVDRALFHRFLDTCVQRRWLPAPPAASARPLAPRLPPGEPS